MKKVFLFTTALLMIIVVLATAFQKKSSDQSWIRINQLGYTPTGIKVAVWCTKEETVAGTWQLIDAVSQRIATSGKAGNSFGAYGPFLRAARIDFTAFKKPGRYYLQIGNSKSPEFPIGVDVYKGAADFCLRYMRQQRTGFNPFLKDSCHTRDGYALYGSRAGIPDSSFIDVTGGWHDASDYLQYTTTSANATFHLLAAYRDFPKVFTDQKLNNGLEGKNDVPDILDEAKWGLAWLLKMHPRPDWMFNQIADDRDHISMRIPKEDTQYGKGIQRPVYFIDGEPQQRGKFMNQTKGTSSTAAKLASAFALAQYLVDHDSVATKMNPGQNIYYDKAVSAYSYALKKKGVTQTVSVRSPYIYAEENYVDDMELAGAELSQMMQAHPLKNISDSGYYLWQATEYAKQERITPWLGADTANHYQWYPFINLGHYEAARVIKQHASPRTGSSKADLYYKQQHLSERADTLIGYYREGIERVWNKARNNAFYRGIPFIWCSNNLTVSFAMQCYWYRQLSGDNTFAQLEQANFDWLFGCNPWGTSMVYGLPSWGDTPVDPHSAFTHLKKYPIDGGLVDGPVYTSIYKSLIGITLNEPDEYEAFQNNLAVYHDDYGDYSTNEPTMDGTASLIYLLAAKEAEASQVQRVNDKRRSPFVWSHGGVIRGDTMQKQLAIVFTGDEFAEGGRFITHALAEQKVKASFFFTGNFYRNRGFKPIIAQLRKDGHYLGAHSDRHLLYCDWKNRDSLLVTKKQFTDDLNQNYTEMEKHGIKKKDANFFLPPYEWYNDTVAAWTGQSGLQLINFTPGTRSNADYTWPGISNYQSNEAIFQSIVNYEKSKPAGLNGFMLLVHIGTDPRRTDKFYQQLPELLKYLKENGYQFQTVNQLLANH